MRQLWRDTEATTVSLGAVGARSPGGFVRRRDGPASRIALPIAWIEALSVVADVSRRVGIPNAVVGSLGIAVSKGLDFQPARQGCKGLPTGPPRDLDVFLLGPDDARRRFRTLLAALWQRAHPVIDIVPIYHDQIRFSAGAVTLRYRNIGVPVEPRLFEIFDATVASISIPVLHPLTHLHMMGQNPLFQKTRWNIRCLAGRPRGDLHLPPLSESAFRAFHRFKRAKVHRYYTRYAALRLREELYTRELDGKRSLALSAKRLLRQRYPRVAEFLRQRLG